MTKRPAWIFHLDNFVTTQNLIEHLVKLIAKKLLSVETLKQQAEVVNKVWCQLERLIKSYHITMLKSKFPPNVSNPELLTQYRSLKVFFMENINI